MDQIAWTVALLKILRSVKTHNPLHIQVLRGEMCQYLVICLGEIKCISHLGIVRIWDCHPIMTSS